MLSVFSLLIYIIEQMYYQVGFSVSQIKVSFAGGGGQGKENYS